MPYAAASSLNPVPRLTPARSPVLLHDGRRVDPGYTGVTAQRRDAIRAGQCNQLPPAGELASTAMTRAKARSASGYRDRQLVGFVKENFQPMRYWLAALDTANARIEVNSQNWRK